MSALTNEITINAPIEKIWAILSNVEGLENCDPNVKKSECLTNSRTGLGASRKVFMQDGKNWFDETITACKPNEALTYELTDCSFPINKLKHSYSFQKTGNSVKVQQIMEYTVKFGLLGKLLDALMIGKQFDKGIKQFLNGLKSYTEKN